MISVMKRVMLSVTKMVMIRVIRVIVREMARVRVGLCDGQGDGGAVDLSSGKDYGEGYG